ncbi:unnamed protein product [Linum trigynum]|uniref:Uncharacterized protein n=1 Tax=Linum trigynum TaxID=586398 RepID=A0AAV2D6W0_9ROSI
MISRNRSKAASNGRESIIIPSTMRGACLTKLVWSLLCGGAGLGSSLLCGGGGLALGKKQIGISGSAGAEQLGGAVSAQV